MGASARDIKAGNAWVAVGTDKTPLILGLKSVDRDLQRWAGRATRMGAGMLGAAAGIAAPLVLMTQHFASAGSTLNDMSNRTGASVESLSALGYAARQTGTDTDALEKSAKKLSDNLAAAVAGNTAAEKMFAGLGLNARQLIKLPLEQQLATIADRLVKIRNPAQQAAAVIDLFGKSGTLLLPMLKGGSHELLQLTDRARELGLVMSTEDAEAADELGDRIDDLKDVLGRTAEVVGATLAPAALQAAEVLLDGATAVRAFAEEHPGLIQTVALAAAGLGAAGVASMTLGVGLRSVGTLATFTANTLTAVPAAALSLVRPFTLAASVVSSGAGVATRAAGAYLRLGASIAGVAVRAGTMGVTALVSPVATLTSMVGSLGVGMTTTLPTLAAMGTGLASLAAPLLVGAGIGALGYLFVTQTDIGKRALDGVKGVAQEAATGVREAFGTAVEYASNEFHHFKDDAVATYSGITDAVAAGDLELAGQIGMAGLNAVWQRGLKNVRDLWTVTSTFVESTWSDTVATLLSVGAHVEAGFAILANNIASGFDNGFATIIRAGYATVEKLKSATFDVGITLGTHTEGEKAIALAPLQNERANFERDLKKRNAAREKSELDTGGELGNALKGISADRERRQAEIAAKKLDELADSEKKVADAEAHLAELRSTAADKRAESDAKKAKRPPKAKAGADVTDSTAPKGTHSEQGTFSGIVANANRSGLTAAQVTPATEMDHVATETDQLNDRLSENETRWDRWSDVATAAIGKVMNAGKEPAVIPPPPPVVPPGQDAADAKPMTRVEAIKAHNAARRERVEEIKRQKFERDKQPAVDRWMKNVERSERLKAEAEKRKQLPDADQPRADEKDILSWAEEKGLSLPNTGDEMDQLRKQYETARPQRGQSPPPVVEAAKPRPDDAAVKPLAPSNEESNVGREQEALAWAEKQGLLLPNTGDEMDRLRKQYETAKLQRDPPPPPPVVSAEKTREQSFAPGEKLQGLKDLRKQKGFPANTPLSEIARRFPDESQAKLKEQRAEHEFRGTMSELDLDRVAGGESFTRGDHSEFKTGKITSTNRGPYNKMMKELDSKIVDADANAKAFAGMSKEPQTKSAPFLIPSQQQALPVSPEGHAAIAEARRPEPSPIEAPSPQVPNAPLPPTSTPTTQHSPPEPPSVTVLQETPPTPVVNVQLDANAFADLFRGVELKLPDFSAVQLPSLADLQLPPAPREVTKPAEQKDETLSQKDETLSKLLTAISNLKDAIIANTATTA